ncbi:PEP-CTERM sorting domain-containing protein [Sulfuriroseicoccus oceanibius]|uniref:PEP-CTERM sorting domain-containing protein n=2 Tax=Sulfuriroseicoccus oceanibius TaxID=2707525 RepID=A0A6B3LD06_9BACT|nr:PEP-CTERM sorting domain-containing protein [Sulfuriroseicoccus oceanibius]
MTFSGLEANTEYTFKLLSARANAYGTGFDGTYSMTYGVDSLAGGGSHDMGGSGAGLNATEYTWTFTTGDTAENAVIDLSGSWNLNAVTIDSVAVAAVPEPSSTALLGVSGLALILRRRR